MTIVEKIVEKEKPKTADELADEEINKRVGKAIAERKMKIRKLEAEIKQLKSGEKLPDDFSFLKIEKQKEKHIDSSPYYYKNWSRVPSEKVYRYKITTTGTSTGTTTMPFTDGSTQCQN